MTEVILGNDSYFLGRLIPKRIDSDFKDVLRAELFVNLTDSSDLFNQFKGSVLDLCTIVTKFDSRLLSFEQRVQILQIVEILNIKQG